MVQIIEKKSELEKNYQSARIGGIGFTIPGLVLFLGTVIIAMNMRTPLKANTFVVVCVLISFILSCIGGHLLNKAGAMKAGIKGEQATKDIIRNLPENYNGFAIPNLELTGPNGNTREYDLVLVGETGVFVIETKNYSGRIVGDLNSKTLTKTKISSGGYSYTKTVKNPITQVRGQVGLLSDIFKANGLRYYINGVVYFAGADTELDLSGDSRYVNLFAESADGEYRLCSYILNNHGHLTQYDIQRIANVLGM